MAKLSPKEKAFCREYIICKEGNAAAIKAGYAKNSARITASKLLTKPNIKEEIARLEAKVETKAIITKERVLDELALIGFSDPNDVMNWNESGIDLKPSDTLPREKRAIVKSLSQNVTGTGMSMKVELHGKVDALKEIARLQGYYPAEEVKHSGAIRLITNVQDDE